MPWQAARLRLADFRLRSGVPELRRDETPWQAGPAVAEASAVALRAMADKMAGEGAFLVDSFGRKGN